MNGTIATAVTAKFFDLWPFDSDNKDNESDNNSNIAENRNNNTNDKDASNKSNNTLKY